MKFGPVQVCIQDSHKLSRSESLKELKIIKILNVLLVILAHRDRSQ